jgi:type I restriction enzyme M protein
MAPKAKGRRAESVSEVQKPILEYPAKEYQEETHGRDLMANARRRQSPKLLRPTLWDELDTDATRNLYCRRDDLSNEASVETFFVSRLLTDLGYTDSQIQTKKSLPLLTVGRGHKRERYKPDYALTVHNAPRWIVDAKGTDENLDEWIEQCSGYCLALNRKYPSNENPVQFFVLSNGVATKVYRWDSDSPVLTLDFADFSWGNSTFEAFRTLLAADRIAVIQTVTPRIDTADFQFTRPTSEWARHLFALCHTAIWKSGYGRSPAFMEFIKVMFVKLWADRQLRENPATKDLLAQAYTAGKDSVRLPSSSVVFSVRWITAREAEGVSNPLDTMIFGRLRNEIETNIELRKKKEIV